MSASLYASDMEDARDRLAEYIVTADDELFRELVRFRRDVRKLSQEQVGDLMGIDKSNVSRLESGLRDVQMSTLRRYAMALDVVIKHSVVAFETEDAGAYAKAAQARLDALASETYQSPVEELTIRSVRKSAAVYV